MNRWKDWWEQALRDKEKALLDHQHAYYEWACFTSQQSAEKALKALCMAMNLEVWGHSLTGILKTLKEYGLNIPKEVEKSARLLDTYYIPTRYPNGLPAGKPSEYYTEEESEEALRACENIHNFCKSFLFRQGETPEGAPQV
ncbi:MAG: HEPN domain-containing protein [Aquificaceae bacterium]|nr:HEPN domain-containing protein [Aquificaceae bacterium]MCX7989667.1 HEPN domain-containing protein [Aquificaceae bacterium]MDW8294955.1 HEPN domain-containing protein [Aquificaceae bacterium]